MLSPGVPQRPIAHLDLAEHRILAPTKPRPARDHTLLCLLSIYAALAVVVGLGTFWLTRMECDPMFSDRGLKAVCRNRVAGLDKLANLGDSVSFRLPDGIQ
jgi:hypothetical protein